MPLATVKIQNDLRRLFPSSSSYKYRKDPLSEIHQVTIVLVQYDISYHIGDSLRYLCRKQPIRNQMIC
jgi:hypothetical protein